MKKFFLREWEEYRVLLRSVPATMFSLFAISVVAMNFLANKELFQASWIALDCGFLFSWVSFLAMDCLCKRFGGKAAAKIAILSIAINLLVFLIFRLAAACPGMWGQFYDTGSLQVNEALNATLAGSWMITLGSALAMLVSALTNSFVNMAIAHRIRKDNYKSFAVRSFISTAVGQFVDNMTFALIVSVHLFGWSIKQVLFCSLTAAAFELLMEVLFSGVGYRTCRRWEEEQVGKEYLDYIRDRR